jgi:hypothetical protein
MFAMQPGDRVLLVNMAHHAGLDEQPAVLVSPCGEGRGWTVRLEQHPDQLRDVGLQHLEKSLIGSVSVIHDLVEKPKFNAQKAEVVEYDMELKRYVIKISNGKTKKIKRQNLSFFCPKWTTFLDPRDPVLSSAQETATCDVIPSWLIVDALHKFQETAQRQRFLVDAAITSSAVLKDDRNTIVWISLPRTSAFGENSIDCLCDDILDFLLYPAKFGVFFAIPELFKTPDLSWLTENRIKTYAVLVSKASKIIILGEQYLSDWQLVDEAIGTALDIPVTYAKLRGRDRPGNQTGELGPDAQMLLDIFSS